MYCIVWKGWLLLPNATPNLGITRTWICGLNFAIFSGFKFFNKPEISDSGPQLKVPTGGLVLRIFTSWKYPSTSAGFEPANLGSRDHRDRLVINKVNNSKTYEIWSVNAALTRAPRYSISSYAYAFWRLFLIALIITILRLYSPLRAFAYKSITDLISTCPQKYKTIRPI